MIFAKIEKYSFSRLCPVCGTADGQALGRLNFAVFDGSPLGGDFTLAGCPLCSMVFYDAETSGASDLSLDDSVSRYYDENDYYSTAAPPGSGGDSEFDRLHQRDIIERLAPWLPSEAAAPIMEVGCGCGGLLAALRDEGRMNLYGVDLSPASVSVAKAKGLTAAVASAGRLPRIEPPPRVLIYSHVFEHLPEPHQALAEARRCLTPGGAIYIEVPDAENYGGVGAPFQDFYLEHVNHFSKTSLAALLDSAGFRILALERADFHLPGGRVQKVVWAVAYPASNTHFTYYTSSTQNTDKTYNTQTMHNTLHTLNTHITHPEQKSLSAHETVFQAVTGYLHWSKKHPSMSRLALLAEEQRPVFVWGLSQLIMLLLGSSALARCELRGFIDRDPFKQTRRLLGRPVRGPETLSEAGPGDLVLLAAWGQEEAQRQYLEEIGFRGRAENIW